MEQMDKTPVWVPSLQPVEEKVVLGTACLQVRQPAQVVPVEVELHIATRQCRQQVRELPAKETLEEPVTLPPTMQMVVEVEQAALVKLA
jgi:hypothetical protein